MNMESEDSSPNQSLENKPSYNFDALTHQSRWIFQHASQLTQTEKDTLDSLSPALQECFKLRQQVEDSNFGCFFAEPVNPFTQNLPDYWVKIRRPMDLLTIKRKFLIGIYRSHSQFNEDMGLMFTNFITYNSSRTYLCHQAKQLFDQYKMNYQNILEKVMNKELGEEGKVKLNHQESLASKLEPAELADILTTERKKELGTLLEFLLNRNKISLINTLIKMYPTLKITQHLEEQWVFLNDLTPHQVYSLLRLCQKMKAHDFDTAKLMTVQVDPLLEGYQEFQQKVSVSAQEEVESQFEIQSESEG